MGKLVPKKSAHDSTIPSFESDVHSLIDKFVLQVQGAAQINFATFKSIWRDFSFSFIHQAVPLNVPARDFLQLLYSVALNRLADPSPYLDYRPDIGEQYGAVRADGNAAQGREAPEKSRMSKHTSRIRREPSTRIEQPPQAPRPAGVGAVITTVAAPKQNNSSGGGGNSYGAHGPADAEEDPLDQEYDLLAHIDELFGDELLMEHQAQYQHVDVQPFGAQPPSLHHHVPGPPGAKADGGVGPIAAHGVPPPLPLHLLMEPQQHAIAPACLNDGPLDISFHHQNGGPFHTQLPPSAVTAGANGVSLALPDGLGGWGPGPAVEEDDYDEGSNAPGQAAVPATAPRGCLGRDPGYESGTAPNTDFEPQGGSSLKSVCVEPLEVLMMLGPRRTASTADDGMEGTDTWQLSGGGGRGGGGEATFPVAAPAAVDAAAIQCPLSSSMQAAILCDSSPACNAAEMEPVAATAQIAAATEPGESGNAGGYSGLAAHESGYLSVGLRSPDHSLAFSPLGGFAMPSMSPPKGRLPSSLPTPILARTLSQPILSPTASSYEAMQTFPAVQQPPPPPPLLSPQQQQLQLALLPLMQQPSSPPPPSSRQLLDDGALLDNSMGGNNTAAMASGAFLPGQHQSSRSVALLQPQPQPQPQPLPQQQSLPQPQLQELQVQCRPEGAAAASKGSVPSAAADVADVEVADAEVEVEVDEGPHQIRKLPPGDAFPFQASPLPPFIPIAATGGPTTVIGKELTATCGSHAVDALTVEGHRRNNCDAAQALPFALSPWPPPPPAPSLPLPPPQPEHHHDQQQQEQQSLHQYQHQQQPQQLPACLTWQMCPGRPRPSGDSNEQQKGELGNALELLLARDVPTWEANGVQLGPPPAAAPPNATHMALMTGAGAGAGTADIAGSDTPMLEPAGACGASIQLRSDQPLAGNGVGTSPPHLPSLPAALPPPGPDVPLSARVGAIYALYCLYGTQICQPPVRIYVPLPLLSSLTATLQEAAAAGLKDIVAIVRDLWYKAVLVPGGVARFPGATTPFIVGRMRGLVAAVTARLQGAQNNCGKAATTGSRGGTVSWLDPSRRRLAAFHDVLVSNPVLRQALLHLRTALPLLADMESLEQLCELYGSQRTAIFNGDGVSGGGDGGGSSHSTVPDVLFEARTGGDIRRTVRRMFAEVLQSLRQIPCRKRNAETRRRQRELDAQRSAEEAARVEAEAEAAPRTVAEALAQVAVRPPAPMRRRVAGELGALMRRRAMQAGQAPAGPVGPVHEGYSRVIIHRSELASAGLMGAEALQNAALLGVPARVLQAEEARRQRVQSVADTWLCRHDLLMQEDQAGAEERPSRVQQRQQKQPPRPPQRQQQKQPQRKPEKPSISDVDDFNVDAQLEAAFAELEAADEAPSQIGAPAQAMAVATARPTMATVGKADEATKVPSAGVRARGRGVQRGRGGSAANRAKGPEQHSLAADGGNDVARPGVRRNVSSMPNLADLHPWLNVTCAGVTGVLDTRSRMVSCGCDGCVYNAAVSGDGQDRVATAEWQQQQQPTAQGRRIPAAEWPAHCGLVGGKRRWLTSVRVQEALLGGDMGDGGDHGEVVRRLSLEVFMRRRGVSLGRYSVSTARKDASSAANTDRRGRGAKRPGLTSGASKGRERGRGRGRGQRGRGGRSRSAGKEMDWPEDDQLGSYDDEGSEDGDSEVRGTADIARRCDARGATVVAGSAGVARVGAEAGSARKVNTSSRAGSASASGEDDDELDPDDLMLDALGEADAELVRQTQLALQAQRQAMELLWKMRSGLEPLETATRERQPRPPAPVPAASLRPAVPKGGLTLMGLGDVSRMATGLGAGNRSAQLPTLPKAAPAAARAAPSSQRQLQQPGFKRGADRAVMKQSKPRKRRSSDLGGSEGEDGTIIEGLTPAVVKWEAHFKSEGLTRATKRCRRESSAKTEAEANSLGHLKTGRMADEEDHVAAVGHLHVARNQTQGEPGEVHDVRCRKDQEADTAGLGDGANLGTVGLLQGSGAVAVASLGQAMTSRLNICGAMAAVADEGEDDLSEFDAMFAAVKALNGL